MKKITIILVICLFYANSPANAQRIFWWKKDKSEKEQPQPQREATPNQPQRETTPTVQPEPASTRPTSPAANDTPARDNGRITPDVANRINRENDRIRNTAEPVVTESPNGNVNWTEQFIEAKGESVIDSERFSNVGQARAMATRGAIVVAQRNLLEIIQGVQVTSETVVIDMVTTSDVIKTKVEGVIKGAVMFGDPIEKNGMIEVIMRVPLYGNNGLAGAVYDAVPDQSAAFQAASGSKAAGDKSTVDKMKDELLGSIFFDFKGQKFDPSLFPVVLDENNNLLLDLSKIYDPQKGNFPSYLNASRELLDNLGIKEGVQFIDAISTQPGVIKVDTGKSKGINWTRIGEIAGAVGKFLLLFL